MQNIIENYTSNLTKAINLSAMQSVPMLAEALMQAWRTGAKIYLCGNGGSAGNAIHLANDFIYGAGMQNAAVLTCLANDIGYDSIYSEQIKVKGNPEDVLIVLSGSGNSPNVVKALETANQIGMKTFAILGFTGGRCKELAQCAIHFEVNDMQIAEDLQLIVGHMCMQWLAQQNLSES